MLKPTQILRYWLNSINMNERKYSEHSIVDYLAFDDLCFPSWVLWGNKEWLQIWETSTIEVNQFNMLPIIKSMKTEIIESFQRKHKFTNLLFNLYFMSIGRIIADLRIIRPRGYNVVKKHPVRIIYVLPIRFRGVL